MLKNVTWISLLPLRFSDSLEKGFSVLIDVTRCARDVTETQKRETGNPGLGREI